MAKTIKRETIHNWLRSRDIVEFLGLWEELHNPDFKRVEFDTFKTDAGTNGSWWHMFRLVAGTNVRKWRRC